MAGYSSTPLIKKLGIKEGSNIFLVDAPADYALLLELDIAGQVTTNAKTADIFHVFVQRKKDLEKHFKSIISKAKSDAVIWISWYKKSSGIDCDINDNVIREVVLPTGWVDVKVCAVSDIWSGLKIVKRKENR